MCVCVCVCVCVCEEMNPKVMGVNNLLFNNNQFIQACYNLLDSLVPEKCTNINNDNSELACTL